MSLREKLDKNKRWAVPLILLLAAGAVVWSVMNSSGGQLSDKFISRAYYTTDEGNTYFEDDLNKSYPFDHDGKKAYRAYVFKCGNGKPFVGVLGRLASAKPAAAIPSQYAQPSTPVAPVIEMKKPGTDAWYPSNSAEAYRILSLVCPDNHPIAVIPGQSD